MIRRALIFIIFVSALGVLYLASRQLLDLDDLIAREQALRSSLARRPLIGFFIGFMIYVGVSLVPGTTGKALIIGWFYRFWIGLLIVNLGLTIAAIISFCVSRYIFHDAIVSRYGHRLARVNSALERDGASYLFAARILHTPYSVTNYVLGVTRIRLVSFWWSTQLGILPGNLVFVYAGAQAPTLQELEQQGLRSLFSPGLLIAFIAVSVLPLLARHLVHRLLDYVESRRGVKSQQD
jgi:uncharacterized membrane protein YdjX (TVP38/TMEM64 family)